MDHSQFELGSLGRGPLTRRALSALPVCAVLSCLLLAGCASSEWVVLRHQPKNPLTQRLNLMARGGPKPTERTMQLLRRYDLDGEVRGDNRPLLAQLHQIARHEPSLEMVYAMSELSYLGAAKVGGSDKQAALDLYGAAVMHAYHYLFDPQFNATRNAYDPQYRGASEIYNAGLEGALRIVQKQGVLRPGCTHTIRTAGCDVDVTVRLPGNSWKADDFDRFEFVSDYKTQGLRNHYAGHGLGVPLVAVRRTDQGGDPSDRYYPPGLSFPCTAFLRVDGVRPSQGPGDPPRLQAVLDLCDPLVTNQVAVAGRAVPLETDLTTPLAFFLSQPEMNETDLSTVGLLYPDKVDGLRGVYMLEPFNPDKVPVVLVHGLWSSPVTWMEMYNDLRSDPEIRQQYQFWFYLYPSGQPFWISARQMRVDLASLRETLDPLAGHPALGQSVLIGHSMGGLLSKLQSIDSEDHLWNVISNRPINEVQASPKVRQALEETFFVAPSTTVRRVITIGTPYGGSHFANNTTRWMAGKLISLPGQFLKTRQQLLRENPDVFREKTLLATSTSLDSLSPDSPLLPVLRAEPPAPWIRYHNIIGHVPKDGWLARVSKAGDGVVSLASARNDFAQSEIMVTADHSTVHSHPRTILEVRRILMDHLAELRGDRAVHAAVGTSYP